MGVGFFQCKFHRDRLGIPPNGGKFSKEIHSLGSNLPTFLVGRC